jgi:ribonuclease Z
MIGVTILGNNSALPAYDRHPTAQVITLQDQLLLIDCGEGTQMQLSRYKVKRGKLNHVFISHLHGDHYFGLIGLVTSMGLLGREQPLHLYAPPGLEQIVQLQLSVAATTLPFELVFHPLTQAGLVYDQNKFTVECFPTQHRIPCWGFVVREKKMPRKLNRQAVEAAAVPADYYPQLKAGQDYQKKNGAVLLNEELTFPNTPPASYAYCADTIFDKGLVPYVQNVQLLYHETTYLADQSERAAARFHTTTHQAAEIAALASAGQLVIGHFSSKYESLDAFLTEAQSIFPRTALAVEGVSFLVK